MYFTFGISLLLIVFTDLSSFVMVVGSCYETSGGTCCSQCIFPGFLQFSMSGGTKTYCSSETSNKMVVFHWKSVLLLIFFSRTYNSNSLNLLNFGLYVVLIRMKFARYLLALPWRFCVYRKRCFVFFSELLYYCMQCCLISERYRMIFVVKAFLFLMCCIYDSWESCYIASQEVMEFLMKQRS